MRVCVCSPPCVCVSTSAEHTHVWCGHLNSFSGRKIGGRHVSPGSLTQFQQTGRARNASVIHFAFQNERHLSDEGELHDLHHNPPNNEAQKNISKIQTHFVAPWARGYGLAKAMIDLAIEISKENNMKSIQLDIRETQSAAIQLFENKGFIKWGTNPSYAFINGSRIKGYYYYKDLL